ncbi:sigma-E factor negative regulatory protein [Ramlibacter tataouinensis]|uniref:Sigma-E factor negative regulatory protein n=2 Tax=Ramlibacter tataouinensis TaxID=94132 RepID=A0A127JZF5_9BURK|nr:sigma-E factor negative regulatory protein [Ramlibacter tataouinensis]
MAEALSSKRVFTRGLLAFGLGLGLKWGHAQPPPAGPPGSASQPNERGVSEWLARMHDASRGRSYVGIFVISANNGVMSSARIWHGSEGDVQVERVEALTGAPRSVFRRNEQVVTFLPESHVVRTERRESLGIFTSLVKSSDSPIPDFYTARRLGSDRVAGFEADVVQLAPRDNLRWGYRIWSEKKSGLVVKLQTLDGEGNVLEQSAFSELALDVPVRTDSITRMMTATEGWRVERAEVLKTTADAEGWQLRSVPAGFKPVSCYKRPVLGAPVPEGTMQWIFSDGLAAVSLFVEANDSRRHGQEALFASGATHTLTRRVQEWWLTVVGEVPPRTLRAFAHGLERRK